MPEGVKSERLRGSEVALALKALIPYWKIKGRQKTEKGRRTRGEHKVSKGVHFV
jgi:hypothetical protein